MLYVQCILKNSMHKLIRAQLLNAWPIWGKYIPDKISQCLLISYSCWLLGLKTENCPSPKKAQGNVLIKAPVPWVFFDVLNSTVVIRLNFSLLLFEFVKLKRILYHLQLTSKTHRSTSCIFNKPSNISCMVLMGVHHQKWDRFALSQ